MISSRKRDGGDGRIAPLFHFARLVHGAPHHERWVECTQVWAVFSGKARNDDGFEPRRSRQPSCGSGAENEGCRAICEIVAVLRTTARQASPE
jgi:hypothetical protein